MAQQNLIINRIKYRDTLNLVNDIILQQLNILSKNLCDITFPNYHTILTKIFNEWSTINIDLNLPNSSTTNITKHFLNSEGFKIILEILDNIDQKQYENILIIHHGIACILKIEHMQSSWNKNMIAKSIKFIKCDDEDMKFYEELSKEFPNGVDILISNMSLHFANHLPQIMLNCYEILSSGGLFLATLIGGVSLKELTIAMMELDVDLYNKAHLRIMPMINHATSMQLLQYAKTKLPTVGVDRIEVVYNDFSNLLSDAKLISQYANSVNLDINIEYIKKLETKYKINSLKHNSDDTRFYANYEIIALSGMK